MLLNFQNICFVFHCAYKLERSKSIGKLAFQILTALVQGVSIPVTCKIRILPTVSATKLNCCEILDKLIELVNFTDWHKKYYCM